jgi:hypothetical protein
MAKAKSIIKAPAHITIFFFMLSFPPWMSLGISFFGFESHRIASGAGLSARPAGVHGHSISIHNRKEKKANIFSTHLLSRPPSFQNNSQNEKWPCPFRFLAGFREYGFIAPIVSNS